MVAAKTLKAILEVENSPELLEFRCKATGIALWPLARSPLLRMIMSDWLYQTPLVLQVSASSSRLGAASSLCKSVLHNLTHRSRFHGKVAIRATGAGHMRQNGVFFNRLSDHFSDAALDQTVVIEDLFDWNWPSPRHNSRVLYSTPTTALSSLYGQLWSGKSAQQAGDLTALLFNRTKDILGWEPGRERQAWFTRYVQTSIARTPYLTRLHEKMLGRLKPRLVLVEEACYGGRQATLIAAARTLGIATAEYQHGAISSGHDAYNLAPAIRNSSLYRESLPDYFLSYGTWWAEQVSVPLQFVTIGNPHRSTVVAQFSRDNIRDAILVLGDGTETDTYVSLARNLARQMEGRFRVLFRPHPQERQSFYARQQRGEFQDIKVDSSKDIYDSFRIAHAVVSEVSTGLFEAVGLVPRIFLWSTDKSNFAFPSHRGLHEPSAPIP